MADNKRIMMTELQQYSKEAIEKETLHNSQTLLNSLFVKLETMQKQIMSEKIACLETQLAILDDDLTAFLEKNPSIY